MTGHGPQDALDVVLGRQQLKRRGDPQHLVGMLVLLCSDRSGLMTGTLVIDPEVALQV